MESLDTHSHHSLPILASSSSPPWNSVSVDHLVLHSLFQSTSKLAHSFTFNRSPKHQHNPLPLPHRIPSASDTPKQSFPGQISFTSIIIIVSGRLKLIYRPEGQKTEFPRKSIQTHTHLMFASSKVWFVDLTINSESDWYPSPVATFSTVPKCLVLHRKLWRGNLCKIIGRCMSSLV